MFWFFFYKKYIKETLVYSPFTYQNKIKIAYAAIVKTHCNLKRMSQRILLFVKKSIYNTVVFICYRMIFKHTWFQIHERLNGSKFGWCWYLHKISAIVLTSILRFRVWFLYTIVFETIFTYTIDFFVSKISTTAIV